MAVLLFQADASKPLPLRDGSVHCVVTSPPYYGLRDYGTAGQLGLEPTPEAYGAAMVGVFREVWRILRDDGCVWLNIGDGFTGKQRQGIPHRLVFALQADGWYWRDEIVWHKKSPMPESVTDRTTKAHEFVFLLTKSPRYWYDNEAVKEEAEGKSGNYFGSKAQNGTLRKDIGQPCSTEWSSRNLRSVWSLPTTPYPGAHFATMPPDLAARCIKAGSPPKCCATCGRGWVRIVERTPMILAKSNNAHQATPQGRTCTSGTMVQAPSSRTLGWQPCCTCPPAPPVSSVVFDPFVGSGTTPTVADGLNRIGVGCDLSAEYLRLARQRCERPHAPARKTDRPMPLFAEDAP